MKIKKSSKVKPATKPSKTKPPSKPKAAIVKKAKTKKPNIKKPATKTQTIHETIETEHSLDKLASLFNLAAIELKKVAEEKNEERTQRDNLQKLQYMWDDQLPLETKREPKYDRPVLKRIGKKGVKIVDSLAPTLLSNHLLVNMNDPNDVCLFNAEIEWAIENSTYDFDVAATLEDPVFKCECGGS